MLELVLVVNVVYISVCKKRTPNKSTVFSVLVIQDIIFYADTGAHVVRSNIFTHNVPDYKPRPLISITCFYLVQNTVPEF